MSLSTYLYRLRIEENRSFPDVPQTLIALVDGLAHRPDMQNAILRLMRPDNMLKTFSELAVKDPDLMRLLLQASVAALVNVQSAEAVDAEIKKRAVTGN